MRLARLAIGIAMWCAMWSCQSSPLHTDVDRSVYPVKGIDLSAHNGHVDFAQAKADSVEFVILKATEGTDFCDAMFATNCDAAHSAGLMVGAYHFFRFDSPGHLQAYHFLRAVQGRSIDLPLAIDVEDWQNAEGVPDNEVISQLRVMADVMRAAGYHVMVYTNKKGLASYVEPAFEGSLPVWLSAPTGCPAHDEWSLWQHSHEGAVNGANGPVDLNTFNGSRADFEAWRKAQTSADPIR